ncbi:M3 family metallopeptidase [Paraferrimonas sedimenticola]|uniref:Zn-dependent oligopeptidase n=1 Tax=Paraferrimonas sedimenticola TaxID=375674 RepID=A0AA37RVP8_9GAMM|nr:M3 family metallopeptidase [Paraferrimonas sedimenticola]GLP96169.1 Zn-dependent oligopeptidase [Paraferrimonas sedimenticola]
MSKSTSILTLAFSLLWSAWATSAPLDNLLQQCRALTLAPVSFDPNQSLTENLVLLERADLARYNLSDAIDYQKSRWGSHFSRDQHGLLLACQQRIASQHKQRLQQLLREGWPERLKASSNPEFANLAKRWLQLYQKDALNQQPLAQLSQFAEFRARLKASRAKIDLTKIDCQLSDNSISMAQVPSYLINQADENCRRTVWQAYQLRGGDAVEQLLARIYQQQREQAKRAGYREVAEHQLSRNWLSEVDWVYQYLLASYSKDHAAAPWQLARLLKQDSELSETSDSIQVLTDTAEELGLRLEGLQDNYFRVWLEQRLLGELRVNWQDGDIGSWVIRQSIVGVQVGVVELQAPANISLARQQHKYHMAIARALKSLAAGSRFYWNNRIGLHAEASHLASYWLSAMWQPRFGLTQAQFDSRRNLHNARALQALTDNHSQLERPTDLFSKRFGESAPEVELRFASQARLGANVYQSLWAQDAGRWLALRHQNQCLPLDSIFNTLFVNANGAGLTKQFQQLVGLSSPPQINQRMLNEISDSHTANQPCSVRYSGKSAATQR